MSCSRCMRQTQEISELGDPSVTVVVVDTEEEGA